MALSGIINVASRDEEEDSSTSAAVAVAKSALNLLASWPGYAILRLRKRLSC